MYLSVDLPIDNDTTAIIKKFVETIALLFDDENCDIDTSVFNLSRLSKCVPTIAKKGRSTKDRPHRESKYIYIPDQIKSSSIQLFKQVIESVSPPEEDAPNFRNNYKAFDIRGFIQKHGISVSSETVVNGITKLVLMSVYSTIVTKHPIQLYLLCQVVQFLTNVSTIVARTKVGKM